MKALILQLGLSLLLVAAPVAAQTAISPEARSNNPENQSPEEVKAELYQKFVVNRLDNSAAAYEAAKEYLQKYEDLDGPDNQFVAYIKKWVALYEKLSQESGKFQSDEVNKRVYRAKEVEVKARIFYKPEPVYTKEARNKGVQVVVILSAVFCADGQVTNIKTISGLPSGLTGKALEAARLIKFTPAIKDGQPVSQLVRLKYTFILD
jgi:TonB family protein